MTPKTTRVPIDSLIEDQEIYPRHKVDGTHVSALVEAKAAGSNLPPVIADRATNRIVDGVHRWRAHKRSGDSTIAVEFRDYENEADLLVDAVRLNSSHGRPLDSFDRTRSALLLQNAGCSIETIAITLHIPPPTVTTIVARIARTPAGIPVPLKRPLLSKFKGETLTAEQVVAHRTAPGTSYKLLSRQLREGLEYGFVDLTDEVTVRELTQLASMLTSALSQVAVAS